MRSFKQIIALLSIFLLALSCKEEIIDIPKPVGSGLTEVSWQTEMEADDEGELFSLTFISEAAWSAVSSESSWCEILTPEGVAGEAALRVKIHPNLDIEPRTAEVTISVEGYPQTSSFTIIQEEGVQEKGEGRYRDINAWVYEKMEEYYLWNEQIPLLALDYSLDYQAFLTSMLDGIAAYDDVNHDDGSYKGDKRTGYYTKIVSSAPTKAVGEQVRGNGFYLLRPANIGVAIGVIVEAVVPGGPAELAGIKRGHFITEVNGVAITMDNYKNVTSLIYDSSVSLEINSVTWEGENRDRAVLTTVGTVSLSPSSYEDPAIYKSETIELSDGRKVGYLLYMGFHTDYDEELFAVFDKFKADGVEELVLDLRYNNGGEIISSNVLATLIAGPAYEDRTLAKLTFNKKRTEAGETAVYKIGNPATIEYPDGYQPIAQALEHSLSLDKVYVIATSVTASASEIIINGLRGLDIDVNLIGTTTSGKNVGMEGFSKTYHNYSFLFYPVSFYVENEKGFRDYPDGFEPDYYLDDSSFFPGGDFGSDMDFLCNVAYYWIRTGVKPGTKVNKASISGMPASPVPMTRHTGGNLVIYR